MRLYLELKINNKNPEKKVSNFVVVDEIVLHHKEFDYIARIQTGEIGISTTESGTRVLCCKNIEVEFEDVPKGKRPSLTTVFRELNKFNIDSIVINDGGSDEEMYSSDFDIEILAASIINFVGDGYDSWKQKDFSPTQLKQMNFEIEIY